MKQMIISLAALACSWLSAYDIKLTHNVPHLDKKFMSELKSKFSIQDLVETGTWDGETALIASEIFDHVHTVEIHPEIFKRAEARLKNSHNVTCYCDESANFLAEILPTLPEETLFWLDAHYCGTGTGTIYINDTWIKSPLKDEVTLIIDQFKPHYVILIDDVRGYLNVPDAKRVGREYATVHELYTLAKEHNPPLAFHILGDMALIYDPTTYRMSPSPFIEACTASYIFNPFAPYTAKDVQKVIRAEAFLATAPIGESDEIIQKLCSVGLHEKDWGGFYPYLWRALRKMRKEEYSAALSEFEYLRKVTPAMWHDRFSLYMAKCYKKLGKQKECNECMEKLSPMTRKCAYLFN